MNILSIQSHVAYGHVGNSAAVFPLQRLGAQVWPIHTVQFSNHTGYGVWRGEVFSADLIDQCVAGIAERGALALCDGVLSGYVGSPETGAAILRAVARVKAENPKALYCCDPVIGDIGRGVFVRQGVPEFFKHAALPLADILTPNHFELEYLMGAAIADIDQLRASLNFLCAQGPKAVLVTSLRLKDTPPDHLDCAAMSSEGLMRLRTPRLGISVNGAGDVIAALFFYHFLRSGSVRTALQWAAASVYELLRRTLESGDRELALVAAQEAFIAPKLRFEPQIL